MDPGAMTDGPGDAMDPSVMTAGPGDAMDPSAMTPSTRKQAEATGNGYNQTSDGMNHQVENNGDDSPPPSYQETYPTTTNDTEQTQVYCNICKPIYIYYYLFVRVNILIVTYDYCNTVC